MSRYIRSIIHHVLKRNLYSSVEKNLDKIKKFDDYNFKNKISSENNLLNNLFVNGFTQESSFFSDDLNNKISSLIPNNVDSKPGCTTYKISDDLKSNIINEINRKFRNDLIEYLNDEPLFYRIELKQTISDKSAPTVSSYWHYDIVGKRLKLFYFLDSSITKINTHLIEKTHLSNKSSNFIISRISSGLAFFKSLFTNKIKTVTPIKGTFFIFDTNLYHRGGLITAEKSFRWTLQCDIISRKKYDLLYQYGDKIGL